MIPRIGLFLAILSLAGLAGCNTPGCLVQDKVVQVSSTFVANSLQCSHQDAISADLTKFVSNFGLCKAAQGTMQSVPQGQLANTLCPVVASAVVGYVVANGIPATWGCTATNASTLAISKLTDLCEKIPASEFEEKP